MPILAARPVGSIRNILDVKKEVPGFIICLLDHDDHVMIGFMVLGI